MGCFFDSTGVQWSTLNPVWDAKWDLLNVSDGTDLEIFVMDKNKLKEDTFLGKTILTLGSNLEGTQEHVLEIIRPDGRKKGKVLVQVCASLMTSIRL